MIKATPNPWIAYRRPRPGARLRLFCFTYAGGGASIYRTWVTELPVEIEVCPVQLPGREQRLREQPFLRIPPLMEALGEALDPLFDMPFAFFGHSLGALIGYELTHWLRRLGKPTPVHLLVSARRSPQLPREKDKEYHLLPDAEFRAKLLELEGTPREVLEHEELMELILPLLRSDFELNETHPPNDNRAPLECPITAFGGLADKDVNREGLEPWGELTCGPFRLQMFPGGHFFLHEVRPDLIRAVAETLLRPA